jgi:endoglucanase
MCIFIMRFSITLISFLFNQDIFSTIRVNALNPTITWLYFTHTYRERISMKKLTLLCAILISAFLMKVELTAQNISAKEQCIKLGRGVNIIGYDTTFWKYQTQGRFKENYFAMIKEAGFSSLRINLHPFSWMDSKFKIDPKRLEILDWVVKKGLEAKLMLILDMHEYNAMADDPIAKKEMFLSVWKQLAPRYKDQPNEVLFELLNEPNQKLTDELWNGYLIEALKIVRETNPNRTVIIGPGSWNGIENLKTLELPKEDRNIIVTVHFYQPLRFTHQGAYWNRQYKDSSGITWMGTEEEKNDIERRFKIAADWSEANDRPIFLGEFGAYDKGDMDSRVRYTSFVARTAEKLNFSWAYWQFDSDFIVYNIDKESWVEPILNSLITKP